MSGDREQMLARIREALHDPAPRHYEAIARGSLTHTATAPFREWLPQVGVLEAEQVALFAKQSEVLRTDFRECMSVDEAGEHIATLAKEHAWKRLALHAGEITDQLAPKLGAAMDVVRIEFGYDKDALESCDGGVTECESLVAQTGSVCVTSRSSGGRALSVLPPHHIVLARRDQIVSDLSTAYERLAAKYPAGYPSFISFISGPSRTGDIERILVLGAHGPKKLTILLLP